LKMLPGPFQSNKTAKNRHILTPLRQAFATTNPAAGNSVCISMKRAGIMLCAITVTRCSSLAHTVHYIAAYPAREYEKTFDFGSKEKQ
jgi:hypothetical protein